MTIHSLAACVLLVLSAAIPARAQAPLPVTVDEAIARAVEASHRLAEARAREQGAEATVQARRAAEFPTVAVSGGYNRTNHVRPFGVRQPDGQFGVIYPDIPDNFFSRLSMQWPIYTAGRFDALERAAEAEARAAGADVEVAQADLRLEVVRTYWALATAGETEQVLAQAVSRADAHVRDVRARFDAGLVPPNDVSSADAQRARQRVQLIEAQNQRRSVAEDLRRLTGLTGEIVPAEKLDPGTTAAATAAINRAELVALNERIAAAEERRSAAAAGRKPTLALAGNADYARPNPRIFPRSEEWQPSWEIGITAQWTLFDGGRNAADVAEATAAASALRARRADVDAIIQTEVRQRRFDLDSALAAQVAAAEGVVSAEDARRVVAERYNVGVATSTEVLDAELALLQAELDRMRALANIRLAEARLQRALGR